MLPPHILYSLPTHIVLTRSDHCTHHSPVCILPPCASLFLPLFPPECFLSLAPRIQFLSPVPSLSSLVPLSFLALTPALPYRLSLCPHSTAIPKLNSKVMNLYWCIPFSMHTQICAHFNKKTVARSHAESRSVSRPAYGYDPVHVKTIGNWRVCTKSEFGAPNIEYQSDED